MDFILRGGVGDALTQRRTSGMEINDVDITKAMTTRSRNRDTIIVIYFWYDFISSEVIDNTDLFDTIAHFSTPLYAMPAVSSHDT